MIELTYGLVVGIGLAAVLLLLWNLWGAISRTTPPSPIWIDFTALVVLGLLGCLGYWFQSSYPQFAVGTTGWGQRLFGVLAGLAFWVWVKYAVSDVLAHRRATQQIPTPSSQWETSTKKSAAITARWWESEPWRAIFIILLIVVGAVMLPRISGIIDSVTRLKVGDFEVQVNHLHRELLTAHNLNLPRIQRNESLNLVARIANYKMQEKRVKSDLRSLEGLGLSSKIATQRLGADAYLCLSQNLLSPAAECLRSQFDKGRSAATLRQFAREVTWDYKQLLDEVSKQEPIARNDIQSRIKQLTIRVRSGMRALECSAELQEVDKTPEITADLARYLPNNPWPYRVLSMLYYIGEDRLAALAVLEEAHQKFPHDVTLLVQKGKSWSEESLGADRSVQAFDDAYKIATILKDFSATRKCDRLPNLHDCHETPGDSCATPAAWRNQKLRPELSQCTAPSKCCKEGFWDEIVCPTEQLCKEDRQRWAEGIPKFQNLLAYSLILSDRVEEKKRIGEAVRLASQAAQGEYRVLFDLPDATDIRFNATHPRLKSIVAGPFWAAVDTYALGLVRGLGHASENEDPQCAMPLLQAALDWALLQGKDLKPSCNPDDATTGGARACIPIRDERYIALDMGYHAVADHLTIASVMLAEQSGSGCPIGRAWENLKKMSY